MLASAVASAVAGGKVGHGVILQVARVVIYEAAANGVGMAKAATKGGEHVVKDKSRCARVFVLISLSMCLCFFYIKRKAKHVQRRKLSL